MFKLFCKSKVKFFFIGILIVIVNADDVDIYDIQKIDSEIKNIPVTKNNALVNRAERILDQGKDRISTQKIYSYNREIIKTTLMEDISLIIILSDDEEIETINIGNKEYINYEVASKNKIILSTNNYYQVDTNLNIVTKSGYVYHFYIYCDSYHTTTNIDASIYIDTKDANNHKLLQKYDLVSFVENISFDYEMTGEQIIAPNFIFSDGKFTWLYFDENKLNRLPIIYIIEDGYERAVNTKKIKNFIVVDGVGSLILKNGEKYVCVTKK